MQIVPSAENVLDVYHTLVGVVTPRPIAWVTTLSPTGVVNLAPFSFFNVFGANPPIVVFSPTLKRDGSKKDTLRNLESLGEFVVHASVVQFAEQINASSKEYPPEQSEVELLGFTTTPSVKIQVPRLIAAPVAMECIVQQIINAGRGPIAPNLVIAEVVAIHVDDAVLDQKGRPDPHKLQTVARMGGEDWCRTTDLFQLPRP